VRPTQRVEFVGNISSPKQFVYLSHPLAFGLLPEIVPGNPSGLLRFQSEQNAYISTIKFNNWRGPRTFTASLKFPLVLLHFAPPAPRSRPSDSRSIVPATISVNRRPWKLLTVVSSGILYWHGSGCLTLPYL